MYDEFKNCKQALKEVHVILENTNLNDVSKIPVSFINFIEEYEDKEYVPTIDFNKPLNEQKLNSDTLSILSLIYLNYWCDTEEKKKEYEERLKQNEENAKNQYKNSLNFNKEEVQVEKIEESNVPVEIKKENWFNKFINWIKNCFKRK